MDPGERLSVVLTAAEWNQVMLLLAEAPYRSVAGLMQAIQTQCVTQTQDPQAAQPARNLALVPADTSA